eukprot:3437705-Rhodomonas_salina.1
MRDGGARTASGNPVLYPIRRARSARGSAKRRVPCMAIAQTSRSNEKSNSGTDENVVKMTWKWLALRWGPSLQYGWLSWQRPASVWYRLNVNWEACAASHCPVK